MLGSYGVGKTSLVRRFVESIFDDRYLTTVGVKIERKRVALADSEMDLIVWDLSGDDDLAQARPSHFRGVSGYILVADGGRRVTVERALAIQQRAASLTGPVPVVVALNKSDLKSTWEIDSSEVQQFAQRGWPCLETSAKTGLEVEDLFLTLAKNMLSEMNELR